jgi:hypothetical protein
MANTLTKITLLSGLVLAGLGAAGCKEVHTAPGVDCGAHPSCGVDGPTCSTSDCISITGCPSAICIDAAQACEESCGTPNCLILESFPLQIRCEDGPVTPGHGGEQSCDELEAQRADELASIQACSADAECGQPLLGTSCGCTRDLVARTDADISGFSEIQASLAEAGCDGLITTCDCPAADGFACVGGRCTWNFTD